jgi:hypothetical protein
MTDILLKEIKEEVQKIYNGQAVQNLELELFELPITNAGQLHTLKGRQTKIEHTKLLGVFTSFKGEGNDLLGSKFKISVQNRSIVSPDFVDFNVIEKTKFIPINEALYPLDVNISASDVSIEYTDGNTTAVPYTVSFYFLTKKGK